MMGGNFGWGGGWMFFGGLVMLLFWVGLIVLIVWALRSFIGGNRVANDNNNTRTLSNPQTPLEILQMRYAKGEISQEDFEMIRRDLQAESSKMPIANS